MPTKADLARIWAEKIPSVRIGKDGIDAGLVEEVNRQLKRKGVIKVKFLKKIAGSDNIDQMAEELAAKTSSSVSGRRGFVVVLARQIH